jgi:uncharacterized membrane protein required for colicin V production
LRFLAILFAVQGLGALLAWAVSRMFKTVGLGWLDRLLGAGFGAAKAALVGIALSLVLTAFPLSKSAPESLASSQLAPYLAHAAALLAYATPHEIKSGFDKTHKTLKDLWRRHAPPPNRSSKQNHSELSNLDILTANEFISPGRFRVERPRQAHCPRSKYVRVH